MRAVHLLGLPPVVADGDDFVAPEGEPLCLPSFIRAQDQEQVIAFYQQIISAQPLPRVEVDWYGRLMTSGRRYLESRRREAGSSGTLVVVKVRRPGEDVREVLAEPTVRDFEHVVVANPHQGEGESLRTLVALAKLVEERCEAFYERQVERLGLRSDGWRLLEELVETLLNPVEIVEAANALVEVQLEGVAPDAQRDTVIARTVVRQLKRRAPAELIALLGWALRNEVDVLDLLHWSTTNEVRRRLENELLLRDGRVQRWVTFLESRRVATVVRAALPTEAQRASEWEPRVRRALSWLPSERAAPSAALEEVEQLISQGRLELARDLLDEHAPVLESKEPSLLEQAFYWGLRAHLDFEAGRHLGAERSLHHALHFAEAANADAELRANWLTGLGACQLRLGKVASARRSLQEAARLSSDNVSTLFNLAACLHFEDQFDEARSYAERLVELSPEYLSSLARTLVYAGQPREALERTSGQPADQGLWQPRALAHLELDDTAAARRCYELALADEPANGYLLDARVELAHLLRALGEEVAAEKLVDEAREEARLMGPTRWSVMKLEAAARFQHRRGRTDAAANFDELADIIAGRLGDEANSDNDSAQRVQPQDRQQPHHRHPQPVPPRAHPQQQRLAELSDQTGDEPKES